MTGALHRALSALTNSKDLLAPVASTQHVKHAAQAVIREWSDLRLDRPDPAEWQRIRREIVELQRARQPIATWTRHQRNLMLWFLFEPHDTPIYRDEWLFRQIETRLNRTTQSQTNSELVALIMSYLLYLPTDSAGRSYSALLKRIALATTSLRLASWRERIKTQHLLEPGGPQRLADQFVAGHTTVEGFLNELAEGFELGHSEFLRSVYRGFGATDTPYSADCIERVFEFLFEYGRTPRYPDLIKPLLNTLIPRWGQQNLSSHLRQLLVNRLTASRPFGDPRLPNNPHWHAMPAARTVVMRWLAGESIELFLDLVSKTANIKAKIGDTRHWDYRRAFWKALFHRDQISDATVILGRNAYALYKKTPELKASPLEPRELIAGNRDQSVLLMTMGELTIAEWSHQGACRIWAGDHPDQPLLHQGEYHASRDLRAPCTFSRNHTQSERYRWQRDVADWLRQNTGVMLQPHDYTI